MGRAGGIKTRARPSQELVIDNGGVDGGGVSLNKMIIGPKNRQVEVS